MQILHPFAGPLQQYPEAISDPERCRPDHCPQCEASRPLVGHGFYSRTLVGGAFEGVIRVRRYLCRACRRTVSLLPEFALPYLRFSVSVIALFLMAHLLEGRTLGAALAAKITPHAHGQFRDPSFAHVAVPGLDHRASVLVLGTTAAPLGLAAFSGSLRPSRRALLGELSVGIENTQYLSGVPASSRVGSDSRREKPWRAEPKKLPCSAMGWSPLWSWSRCRVANSPAARRRSPPVTTRSPARSALPSPLTRCSIGRSAIAPAALKPWPPSPARTAGSRAPSPLSSPI